METKVLVKSFMIALQILLLCQVFMASPQKSHTNKRTYVVYMENLVMPSNFDGHRAWYNSVLRSVSKSGEMLYMYKNVAHGFSARLTTEEAQSMKNQPGVLSMLPDMKYELHTTRTPHFLGLDRSTHLFPKVKAESEVIIGMIDSGVWPERKSFNDTNMGPIPSHWKGVCQSGTNFSSSSCNRKLIGARYFSKGYEAENGPIKEPMELKSPRDTDGHGTHTASTVAGSVVFGASLFGYANGTAGGMATNARVAAYKACWNPGCYFTDILAAMDKAIHDNVHILSLSIGGPETLYYSDDPIAIGAFAAMEKGILVSCSAGNSGPSEGSISNTAPWIITVGASTVDRDFPALVILGNGLNYSGVSLYKGKPLPSQKLPVVYAGALSKGIDGYCVNGTLAPEKVRGKIVICDRGINARAEKGLVVKAAGGVGMILANMEVDGEDLIADAHLLPTSAVGLRFGDAIKHYVSSDPKPTATILFKGTKLGVQPAPMVAGFSSRGPSLIPTILKPDVIAPGINILATWAGSSAPTGLEEDKRRVEFNIISGTSMSCPHVSGLTALLKAAHPKWSPAALRSALMTTAYSTYKDGRPLTDTAGNSSTPFGHGAGHVDPISALDPGLVYDLDVKDYVDFLCSLNYTSAQLKTLTRNNFTCDQTKKYNPTDLNYPSFSVIFQIEQNGNKNDSGDSYSIVQKYLRTLTNVGPPATYNVSLMSQNEMVKVAIEPESLKFTKLNEKKSYTMTFSTNNVPPKSDATYGYARIEWSDGKHIVGSPITITWTT